MGPGVAELQTFRSHRKITAGPGVTEIQKLENHENLEWDLASLSYKPLKSLAFTRGSGVAELQTFRSHRKFTAGPGYAEKQTFENHENLQWDLASLSYKP